MLAARLKELSTPRERDVGLGQQVHLVRFIVRHVEGRARVQDPVEWQARVASIWTDTYLAIMIMVMDANAQLVVAQRAAAVETSKFIAVWAGDSFRKGAGPAHRYARKDFGLPLLMNRL